MKYVALLRGINVGGNNKVSMATLKEEFEACGLTNVLTYINSGNVIFETGKKHEELIELLEKRLTARFGFSLRLVIRSQKELGEIVKSAPSEWKKQNDLRQYVAFIKEPMKAKDIASEVDVREGIDELKVGSYVLYMSTKMSGLTKSAFNKLASKKVYKDMTIRNFNTVQKILGLMKN